MRNIYQHFSTVAERYRKLQTTDIEPPIHMKKMLWSRKVRYAIITSFWESALSLLH